MDETLLRSQFASQRDRFRQAECRPDGASFAREADFDFTIRVNRTHRERVAVYKRPGLDTFLREAAARFEVIVFTAAIPLYAARVLDLLDPDQKYISARLFREATVVFQNMPYVKDISVLGRDPARVVIVDNNPGALIASPDNAIPISSYYADSDDNELAKLGALLTKLSQARDVRPSLEKKFRFRLLLDQARRLRDAYSERFV